MMLYYAPPGLQSVRLKSVSSERSHEHEEDINSTSFHTHSKAGSHLQLQIELLYAVGIIFVGVFVRHVTQTMQIPVPYTVTVFLMGVVFGFLPVGAISDIGPYTIIIVFMPVLIFEGAFSIDVYVFKQIFLQVLLMAFPALMLMIAMTATVSAHIFKDDHFDWKVSMLFGSILSATDPVAVVAIMRELGVKKHLSLLIEGESMLNDGTAMVFFAIFMDMIISKKDFSIGHTTYELLKVSTGGPAVGYIMARIAVFWLEWTFNDSLVEILITLATSYLTFYIAEEFLGVSGVLAVVTCGVYISEYKTCISPEVESFLHCFWETLSFMANTLIFALSGLIISKRVILNAGFSDVIKLLILYVVLHCIRGLTIFIFSPLLQRLGYGMTWQEGVVATWSGLRGAIGLALALIVFRFHEDELIGNAILFNVSLIVVLTLFINATTVAKLLEFLGISGVSDDGRVSMSRAIAMLEMGRERSLLTMKVDRFLSNSNWDLVKSFCTLSDPYSKLPEVYRSAQHTRTIACPNCKMIIPQIPTPEEIHRHKADAVRKYLKLFKKAIWEQFEHGTLCGYGAQILDDMIEHAYDTDLQTVSVRAVKAIWRIPLWLRRLETFVTFCQISKTTTTFFVLELQEKSPSYRAYYNWKRHWLLVVYIYGTINIITLTESSLYLLDIFDGQLYLGLDNTLWAMVILSWLFFIFRVVAFGVVFLKTPWFLIDAICSCMFLVDMINSLHPSLNGPLDKWVLGDQAIMIYRLAYLLPLCEVLNTFLFSQITSTKLGTLRMFYDIAWAYVNAVEKVSIKFQHSSHPDEFRSIIISHAQDSKMDLIRELGLVQGFYPRIAIESKTSHTIRTVLNTMRDTVYDMQDEGRIDEMEASMFIKAIESKMKRLLAAPPKIEEPSVNKILEGIPWIENDKAIIHYLKIHGIVRAFKTGDVIVHAGDSSDLGIYLILHGLVKIESVTMNFLNFLSTGNVVGEFSCLTGYPRNATLLCETPVDVLYVSRNSIEKAIRKFSNLDPPLNWRLWKMTAIRIASNMLPSHPNFRDMDKHVMLTWLENLDIEFLESDTFDMINKKDVLLIIGHVTSDIMNFQAPCYIDSEVKRLRIPVSSKAGQDRSFKLSATSKSSACGAVPVYLIMIRVWDPGDS